MINTTQHRAGLAAIVAVLSVALLSGCESVVVEYRPNPPITIPILNTDPAKLDKESLCFEYHDLSYRRAQGDIEIRRKEWMESALSLLIERKDITDDEVDLIKNKQITEGMSYVAASCVMGKYKSKQHDTNSLSSLFALSVGLCAESRRHLGKGKIDIEGNERLLSMLNSLVEGKEITKKELELAKAGSITNDLILTASCAVSMSSVSIYEYEYKNTDGHSVYWRLRVNGDGKVENYSKSVRDDPELDNLLNDLRGL